MSQTVTASQEKTCPNRDIRIAAAAAALATYRRWLAEDGAAWEDGQLQPPIDQVALDQMAMCAEWMLFDLLGEPADRHLPVLACTPGGGEHDGI